MSVEEIMKRWEANGVVQRSRGTLLHYHAEQFLNGALIEEPRSPEFDQFVELHRSVLSKSMIFRTEVPMFHAGLRIAGQVDCLCLDKNGDATIWDWKRCGELKKFERRCKLQLQCR